MADGSIWDQPVFPVAAQDGQTDRRTGANVRRPQKMSITYTYIYTWPKIYLSVSSICQYQTFKCTLV